MDSDTETRITIVVCLILLLFAGGIAIYFQYKDIDFIKKFEAKEITVHECKNTTKTVEDYWIYNSTTGDYYQENRRIISTKHITDTFSMAGLEDLTRYQIQSFVMNKQGITLRDKIDLHELHNYENARGIRIIYGYNYVYSEVTSFNITGEDIRDYENKVKNLRYDKNDVTINMKITTYNLTLLKDVTTETCEDKPVDYIIKVDSHCVAHSPNVEYSILYCGQAINKTQITKDFLEDPRNCQCMNEINGYCKIDTGGTIIEMKGDNVNEEVCRINEGTWKFDCDEYKCFDKYGVKI